MCLEGPDKELGYEHSRSVSSFPTTGRWHTRPVPILLNLTVAQAGLQEADPLRVPAPACGMVDLLGNGWGPCDKWEGAQLDLQRVEQGLAFITTD